MHDTVTRRPPSEASPAGRDEGPWLTVPRLWLVVLLGAIGVMGLSRMPSAVDLAYHVKAGELMVAEHTLPRTDALAWTTAGRPWLDQNWGAQLLLYGIWRLGGFPLLTVVNALLAVASWGLVAAACRQRTSNLRVIAWAILVGYATAAATFSVRPQMFSLLLFAAELYLLEAARARPRIALAIPLLMPLWANLHGAFIVGIGLLAIEALAAAWRRDRPGAVRYLLVTVASVAGLLVNPWGVRVLGYALSVPANRVVSGMISEWGPTNVRELPGVLVLPAVGVLVVALVRAAAPQQVPEQLLRMVLLGGLAFWAVRGVAWFGLAIPVATADWLAANPQSGRMFNYQLWGSYLEFRLGPQVQVGFDSRIELPPADRWDRYLAVVAGRWDAERLLDAWGVDHVVTSRRATPALVGLLEASARWRLAFSMGDQLVYQRVEVGRT